jgi:hypothetical protein
MTPRQIIAQFKATQAAIRADDALTIVERDQHMAGAFLLANRLIRFHPQLSAKGSTRPYLAELKLAYETNSSIAPRASA